MEQDPNAHPASLWADLGRQIWSRNTPGGSCASCHSEPEKMAGVAAKFPTLDPSTCAPRNLGDQIRRCRCRQKLTDEGPESENVLALNAMLVKLSAGMKVAPFILPGREKDLEVYRFASQARYFKRMGCINLSCAQCHDGAVGAKLRNDNVSPTYTKGFPIYRLELQGMGSIERRLRACYFGVQAAVPEPGSLVLRQLEIYLSEHARGMPLDGPALRR
ncbi:MAG: sulfur oxidation c-type cytochrome SoxA [Candidatus Protistobacter heckmanni]|nr:sulfur oxidation c-type cytochrome SoxA [Candidatus Protistobacter heckmanni]